MPGGMSTFSIFTGRIGFRFVSDRSTSLRKFSELTDSFERIATTTSAALIAFTILARHCSQPESPHGQSTLGTLNPESV